MRRIFRNFRYKALALGLAVLLWGVSHGTSSIERGFDIPVALRGVPEDLVVTGQSTDAVNIRVKGSRAALRSLTVGRFGGAEALLVSRAANPKHADPLPAIIDFNRQLASVGVELLLLPVPAKASVYSDKLPGQERRGLLRFQLIILHVKYG